MNFLWLLTVFAVFLAVSSHAQVCKNAEIIESIPMSATRDTTLYPFVQNKEAESCQLLSFSNYRGHWFEILTNETVCVTATAVGGNSGTFDPLLLVYQGANCTDLTCVAMNDDATPMNFSSVANFLMESEVPHFILVSGAEDNMVGTFEFSLQVTDPQVCAQESTGRDFCAICPDGSHPDPTAIINDLEGPYFFCDEAAKSLRIVDSSEECSTLQTWGASQCGCEIPDPEISCPLCSFGDEVPDFDRPLPGGTATCGDLNTLYGSSCGLNDVLTSGLASYCGCGGTSQCHMCGPQTDTFDPTLVVQHIDGFPVTCGDINGRLQRDSIMSPESISCDSNLVDEAYGVNVVNFCCEQGSMPTISPQETGLPTCAPSTLTPYPTTETRFPSISPSDFPSELPSDVPSDVPSEVPSGMPSLRPSQTLTTIPTASKPLTRTPSSAPLEAMTITYAPAVSNSVPRIVTSSSNIPTSRIVAVVLVGLLFIIF